MARRRQPIASPRPKNQRIVQTLKATKARRKTQCCRVYELKLTHAKLSPPAQAHLARLFAEAKWFYNFLVGQENLFAADVKQLYKCKAVPVKVGEAFESRELRCLSSQMKQGLLTQLHNSVRGLAQLKKKGRKVGRLKFKRQIRSIPLKQYGNTYQLFPTHQKIKLQGLRELLRVRGMDQFLPEAEFANAHLLQRHGDYYLHVVTYQPKANQVAPPLQGIALDFGLRQQLTFSNGIALDFQIPLPKRLRRLYRRFSKAKAGSKNRDKAKQRRFLEGMSQVQPRSSKSSIRIIICLTLHSFQQKSIK